MENSPQADTGDKAIVVAGTVIGFVLALVAVTLLFQHVIWNLGVDGLGEAVQANVSEIDFGTALGAVFVVLSLRSIFGGESVLNRS